MWNKTLSCCAILGSLSARARAALPLAPSRCETPQNRTASASFVFGRRNKIPRSKLTRYFIFENRRFSTLASLAALLHGEPDAVPRPPPPLALSPRSRASGNSAHRIRERILSISHQRLFRRAAVIDDDTICIERYARKYSHDLALECVRARAHRTRQ